MQWKTVLPINGKSTSGDFRKAACRVSGAVAVSLLLGCASVAGAMQKEPAPANPQAEAASADCFAVGDVAAREACFSRVGEQELVECERLKPNACRPYRDMHAEGQKLSRLTAEAQTFSRKVYASYAEGDQAYLDDLAKGLRDADSAWQAHRDAECRVQPFIEGMSRSEAVDLTEACRLDMTRARIAELEAVVARLKEEARP